MQTEHAAALRILMGDDLYLTMKDLWQKENPVLEPLPEKPGIIIAKEFTFIGKNMKNFLILTNEILQENHLNALESSLLRKQLNLDDVAIVDYSAYPNTNFEQLNASFMPQKLVCFGLKPATLGLPETKLNQISNYADCLILYTYGFNEMLGNKEKTKTFWEPMKAL